MTISGVIKSIYNAPQYARKEKIGNIISCATKKPYLLSNTSSLFL